MTFSSLLRLLAALMIGGAYVTAAISGETAKTAATQTQRRIEKLVAQLGDDSFQVRELAAEELLKYGLPTKASLLEGMKSDDLEIARRARRVWSEIRIEVGWQQVQQVIGDSPQARELFDQMFLAAPDFWYELAETPQTADMSFEQRRKQLQAMLTGKELGNWEGALANLLYFGVRLKNDLPEQELPRVDDLLRTGRTQQAIANNNLLSLLLDKWTRVTITDGPAFDRLLIALRDQGPQAVNIARDILRAGDASAEQKQYALLALVNSDDPEDGKLIDDALNDSTALDILFTKGQLIKSQVKDVALAVQITRCGQRPEDFGFNYLRRNEGTIYSPSSLGFIDAAEREVAFKKWLVFGNAQTKQETP
jgi:hypothetical protein